MSGYRGSVTSTTSPSKTKSDVYEKCIRNYQQELASLRQQVADLKDRARRAGSPDQRLQEMCQSMQRERTKMADDNATLQRKNIELSAKLRHGDSSLLSDKNDHLSKALDEANQREQRLTAKYRDVASKFKAVKTEFRAMGDKYGKLIEENRGTNQQLLTLLQGKDKMRQESEKLAKELADQREDMLKLATEKLELQAEAKRNKESIVKTMSYYSRAKERRAVAESKVSELTVENAKLREGAEALARRVASAKGDKQEIASLNTKNEELESQVSTLQTQVHELGRKARHNSNVEELTTMLKKKEEDMSRLRESEALEKRRVAALTEEVQRLADENSDMLNKCVEFESQQDTIAEMRNVINCLESSRTQESLLALKSEELERDNQKLIGMNEELENKNREIQSQMDSILSELMQDDRLTTDAEESRASALEMMVAEIASVRQSNSELREILETTQMQLAEARKNSEMLMSGCARQGNEGLSSDHSDASSSDGHVRQSAGVANVSHLSISSIEATDRTGELTARLDESREEVTCLKEKMNSLILENQSLKTSACIEQLDEISQSILQVEGSLGSIKEKVMNYSGVEADREELVSLNEELLQDNHDMVMEIKALAIENDKLQMEVSRSREGSSMSGGSPMSIRDSPRSIRDSPRSIRDRPRESDNASLSAENSELEKERDELRDKVSQLSRELWRVDPTQSREYKELQQANEELQDEKDTLTDTVKALQVQLSGHEHDGLMESHHSYDSPERCRSGMEGQRQSPQPGVPVFERSQEIDEDYRVVPLPGTWAVKVDNSDDDIAHTLELFSVGNRPSPRTMNSGSDEDDRANFTNVERAGVDDDDVDDDDLDIEFSNSDDEEPARVSGRNDDPLDSDDDNDAIDTVIARAYETAGRTPPSFVGSSGGIQRSSPAAARPSGMEDLSSPIIDDYDDLGDTAIDEDEDALRSDDGATHDVGILELDEHERIEEEENWGEEQDLDCDDDIEAQEDTRYVRLVGKMPSDVEDEDADEDDDRDEIMDALRKANARPLDLGE